MELKSRMWIASHRLPTPAQGESGGSISLATEPSNVVPGKSFKNRSHGHLTFNSAERQKTFAQHNFSWDSPVIAGQVSQSLHLIQRIIVARPFAG
ncbi:hypothetical protein TNCV_1358791 [Trichonephila clavipes]|uniref:Uncharacterized protein n=1 Tax=Trichonephila clavipes TaxID=2585209 RepID=A0A8X6SBZ8_TRICX|nr:hypothetical protein TNCV_1358791 [Trichonephila clavipes]